MDGLQPRANGILDMIGQLFSPGRQPSGAATYPYVPPERVPESLPAPMMGVDRAMPAQTAPEAPAADPESGARALLDLGIRRPSEAGARARRAMEPEFEAQLPEEEQRKDQGALSILGNFLGNREAMAQLAIAFNTMRLNPDEGLVESMQKTIEQERTQRGANRTAEWLRSQGRADLADLVEQNPALATEALKQMTGGEAPSKVREYQFAVQNGYKGTFMDFVAAQRAPGASVSITMPGAEPQFGQEAAKAGAEYYKNLAETAPTLATQYEKLSETLDLLEQGKPTTGIFSEVKTNLNRLLAAAGDEDAARSASDTQLLNSLLGSDVFPMISALGIGARGLDTPAEREFLLDVMTGRVVMEKDTIRRMAEMRRKYAERAIQSYNAALETPGMKDWMRSARRELSPIELNGGRGSSGQQGDPLGIL